MPLASSIARKEFLTVFSDILQEELELIEREVVLTVLVDIMPANMLVHLAREFNVMGVKGWKFVNTDEERRDLIKSAIELQRFKGTPWSIKEALKRIGYPDVTIDEDLSDLVQVYNGTILYDGDWTYGGDFHWAIFRVIINTDDEVTEDQWADIIAVINEYKPVRSKLLNVVVSVEFNEEVEANEGLDEYGQQDFDYDFDFDLQ